MEITNIEFRERHRQLGLATLQKYGREKLAEWARLGNSGKSGDLNACWKGDNVGYFGVHEWLYEHYGKASHCDHCGKLNAHGGYEWANISGNYLRNVSDYIQLCISCHRKFDKGNFCSKGHPLFGDNLWIRKNGWRVCKVCRNERLKIFNQRKVETFVNS